MLFKEPFLSSLVALIEPKWHTAFLKFIETGEANKDFLDYIEHDDRAQRAVEVAFDAQARELEHLAKTLNVGKDAATEVMSTSFHKKGFFETLTSKFERAKHGAKTS